MVEKIRNQAWLLAIAMLLLIIAAFRPTVPMERDIHTFLLVVDITQSMNTVDMTMHGKPASRIDYTRNLVHNTISSMPCGTRVGVAIFAGVLVTTLFNPVEVCENFHSIQDTISHLEWRQAAHGNSRLGFGMLSASGAVKALREPAQVIFFSDGEEAPMLHAFNRADLSNWQGGEGWLLVGIGGNKPTPVPKMDEYNKVIGYWSNNTYQLEPGIAQVSDETRLKRDDAIATQDYERHLSILDEKYLKALAKEVKADYLRGDNVGTVLTAIGKLKASHRDRAPFEIHWILASIAGILLLWAHLPKHPMELLQRLRGKTRESLLN